MSNNNLTLESHSNQKGLSEQTGQKYTELGASRKGDISEAYIQMLCQAKGAEVFVNAGCTGDTDLILQVGDRYIPIDVKTASLSSKGADRTKRYWHSRDAYRCPDHVYPVVVMPITGTDLSGWEVRWISTRTPEGLENFWNRTYTVPQNAKTTN